MVYEVRTMSKMLVKKGKPIFDEGATIIEIQDLAGGEFLEIKQNDGENKIQIDPGEWPQLRDLIDDMIKDCRDYQKGE